MNKYSIDRIFLGVLVIFFGIILQQSIGMSRTSSLMPRLFSIVGIILCLFVYLDGIIKEKKSAKKTSVEDGKKEEKDWRTAGVADKKGLPFFVTSGIVIGYFVLLVFLGYIVSSIIVMLVIPFLMKFPKKIAITVVALVSTLVLFFAFRYLFNIALPAGLLFDMIF